MGEMLRLIFHNPGIIKLEEIGSRLVGIEEEEEAEEEVIEEVEEEEIGEVVVEGEVEEIFRRDFEEITIFFLFLLLNFKNSFYISSS